MKRNFDNMKRFKQMLQNIFLVLFICCIHAGCSNETDNLVVDDYLDYYVPEILFTDNSYSIIDGNTAAIYTTVSVPEDLKIIDYGHCWITTYGNPTITDVNTSFGETKLKNFTITSVIHNYSSWETYYGRAYIKTENGIIYDLTYYF